MKLFHWLPRVICIIAVLFISLFALDAFAPGLTIWRQLGAFFVHLIPSFILLALLIVAWKWEMIGGLIFLILGLGLSPLVFIFNYRRNHSVGMSLGIILWVAIPFFVVGILFMISHNLKRRKQS
jgi:hypothetical protein